LGVKLWEVIGYLSSQVAKQISRKMIEFPRIASLVLDEVSGDIALSFLRRMNRDVEFSGWRDLETWMDLQQESIPDGKCALRWLEEGLRLLPPFPDRTTFIHRLERLFNGLISQSDLARPAWNLWLPIAMENEEALVNLLRIPNLPERDRLVQELVRRMIDEKRLEQLVDLPMDIQDEIIAHLRIFTKIVLKSQSILRRAKLGYGLTIDELQMIRSDFQWKNDQEQAEMLAYILSNIVKWLNPKWKTPLSYFVEALIFAGRLDKARKICLQNPDLYVYLDGERMDAEELIRRVKPLKRDRPIPEEYVLILKSVL